MISGVEWFLFRLLKSAFLKTPFAVSGFYPYSSAASGKSSISRPIAIRLKKAAAYHPKLRVLIVDLAQGYHRLTTIMQRRTLGRSPALEIRHLNEERAVEAATDLLWEVFVFSVAGFAILYEVQRTSRAEAKKGEMRKRQIEV